MVCRHYGVCGGCTSQDIGYEQQLAAKHDRVQRLLGSMPNGEPMIRMPVGADRQPWRFRHKAAFVFGPGAGGRGLVMGHYARGSRHVVPIDECPVHSDRSNRVAFALRDHLVRARVDAYGSRRGIVRHVLVRTNADESEAVAMLVVTRNDKALRAPIRALLASADRPDGFLLNVNDRPGPLMVGAETRLIAGRQHVREGMGGARFLVSPAAFFQTNPRGAAALQRIVVAAVEGADRVLDLYAGSGLFTVPLAVRGARVTAVEEHPQALDDARLNLRLNKIPVRQVQLVRARVEDALPRIWRDGWDAVVVDPPRQGCSSAVLEGVFERLAPRRAVYVSCNPEALALELPRILRAGYHVVGWQGIDMFPHTDHIEIVVQLVRT